MNGTPDHPAPWDLVDGRSLAALLTVTAHRTTGGCRWRRAACDLNDSDRLEAAAWLVAEEVMKLRCYRADLIFDSWRAAATGRAIPDGGDPSLAEPFVRPSFGLPPDGGALDHAQGYVAEVVWRMLAQQDDHDPREVIYLARPDSDVTSPGADGFVVYQLANQQDLIYRLWEIKKRDGGGGVSATIGRAYEQLDRQADRYLAKLTAQCEIDAGHEALADLFANLVPTWKRADPPAGAGVAVASDAAGLPTTAFTTMHSHFPRLVAAEGIEGCLIGIGSLTTFALSVRRLLWSGLSTERT
jgi:hypothetical protein